MSSIASSAAWKALNDHQHATQDHHMRDLFAEDPGRFERFSVRVGDMLLDYSKNRVTAETMDLLVALAREAELDVLVVEMPVTRAYLEQMREVTDVAAHDRFVAQAVARQGADLLMLRQVFDDPALFTDPEHASPEGRAVATQLVRRHLGLTGGNERL